MTNDNRNAEEIEREIERERAGFEQHLDEICKINFVETIAVQFSDQVPRAWW